MTLAQPFRLMDGLARLAYRTGRMPSIEDLAATPVEQRKAQAPNRWVLGPRPTGIVVTDLEVPGRAGPVPVRRYTPTSPNGRSLLYIHGGGFCVGGLDACDHICADLADLTGGVVVSVDYRLAPENPFPAGLDDCEDALSWLRSEAADPAQIAVCGDSAGGNLSAALCLRLRGTDAVPLTHQVLIYPMLDLTCSLDSWITEATPYLPIDAARRVAAFYYGDADVKDPLVSPLYADDLRGLPPALVVLAEHDTLREDGIAYAAALDEAGVRVQLTVYPRLQHAFLSWPRLTSAYRRSLQEIATFLAS
jgi:acetyl esterase